MLATLAVRWLVGCQGPPTGTPGEPSSPSPDGAPTEETTDPSDPPVTDTGTTEASSSTAETGDTAVEDCATRCDDGLACSTDACDPLGRCVYLPVEDCGWPAVEPDGAVSLAGLDDRLTENVSGGTWDPRRRALWLVRNAGPSEAFRLVEDGLGGWAFDTDQDGEPATWQEIGDAESATLVDPIGAPDVLYVLDEGAPAIVAWDLSEIGDDPVELRSWDLEPWLPDDGQEGAEGLAFVPDAALASWGFVDEDGQPRTSALGMGGLMFVGHQNGGGIFVFDLSPEDDDVELVAAFDTAREETAGLEFDPSTERLYVWHGGDANDLEIVRLSSSDLGGEHRRLDTEYLFDHPGTGNLEGIVLFGVEDCVGGGRPLILLDDGGNERSVELYPDWPLGCE